MTPDVVPVRDAVICAGKINAIEDILNDVRRHRHTFQYNSFIDNAQQVSALGRGDLLRNTWQLDGIGNYWSDYIGYDGDGDGIGDIAYRAEKLFESLMDEHPSLRLFLYSPASQTINFAAAAFPSLRPDPKVIDTAPLMQPFVPPHLTTSTQTASPLFLAASLALLGLGVAVCLFALRPIIPAPRRRLTGRKETHHDYR